jgi:hypothetical protein
MEWCEKHLQRGLKVVGTREVGIDEFECEECFRGLPIKSLNVAAKPAAEIKEKTNMRVRIDDNKLTELHKQGKTDHEIAAGLGCGYVATSAHRRALGLLPNSRGGGGGRKNGAALHKVQPVPAPAAAETALVPASKPEVLQPAPLVALANGHAKARVVMFEMEGSDATIINAIETIKAALAR